jgi:hypothetical protein
MKRDVDGDEDDDEDAKASIIQAATTMDSLCEFPLHILLEVTF